MQPYKYLHLLWLLEAGLSTRAQDYIRVLAEHVCECVNGGLMLEQETVPGWVTNTQHLAEMLKYLVSEMQLILLVYIGKLLRTLCTQHLPEKLPRSVTQSGWDS